MSKYKVIEPNVTKVELDNSSAEVYAQMPYLTRGTLFLPASKDYSVEILNGKIVSYEEYVNAKTEEIS